MTEPSSRDSRLARQGLTDLEAFELRVTEIERACSFVVGSRMRGDYAYDSDVDLMLFWDAWPTRQQWLAICDIFDHADLPLEIDCKVFCDDMPSVFDRQEEYERMLLNMVTLYQRAG